MHPCFNYCPAFRADVTNLYFSATIFADNSNIEWRIVDEYYLHTYSYNPTKAHEKVINITLIQITP
jgi:hypothetical protein